MECSEGKKPKDRVSGTVLRPRRSESDPAMCPKRSVTIGSAELRHMEQSGQICTPGSENERMLEKVKEYGDHL